MEILGKLLGSPARVKIMKLFLLNKEKNFKVKDVVARSRVSAESARREIRLLASVGFIKNRPSDVSSWFFNLSFKYIREFEDLLLRSDFFSKEAVIQNFKKSGQIKLMIVAGVFIKSHDSRVDILIVGEKLKQGKIEEGIRKLEALTGTELVYAVFDTKEFIYRVNMYDKLVRDILDYPHEVLFQSKELSTQYLKKSQKLL